MEDMAKSEDSAVCELMVVQILVGLFGLERDVFINMESYFKDNSSEHQVFGIGIFWGFNEESKLIEVSVWIPTEDES